MKDNVKLGTLGDIFIGLTYRPEDVANDGTIVLRSSNIQNGRLDFDDVVRVKCKVRENLIVKPNDILMCSRNGSAKLVGKCTLLPEMDEEMSFGAFMTIIRTQHNPYLLHFFNSNAFRCQLGSASTTTINQITRKMLDDISVPLYPKELEDYIVSVFNQIDELIWIEEKKLDQLDELVKSRFIELFEGKYKTVKLGDVVKTTSGGTPSKAHPEYYEKGTIPWLTSGEVNAGIITSVKNYITDLGMKNSSAKIVPANSVVIAMYGATAGVTGLIRLDTTTNQAVCSILPSERFVPEYLYYAVASKKDWMISQCQGGGQPNISQGIIKNMDVIDAPTEEQTRFAAFVKQTDKSKLEVKKSLEKLETLKKSLMQQYFG